MATKKRATKRRPPEKLTEQITFRVSPELRTFLESQIGKLPDCRNASEAARALLQQARGRV